MLQPRNACSDDDDVETDHWIARLNRSYERMGPASSNSFFPPPRRVYSERVRGGDESDILSLEIERER